MAHRAKKKSSYTPSRGQFAGRRFRTKWEYRKALKAARVKRGGPLVAIRSKKDLASLNQIQGEKRSDALEVIRRMRRDGLSFRKAVMLVRSEDPYSRVTVRSVHKYAGSALYKQSRTRSWKPRKSDRLLRLMRVPTKKGIDEIEVKDSRIASQIGSYMNAVKKYLNTGDKSGLRPFRGKTIPVGDGTYRFITGPKTLERLAEFGEIYIDSIYERGGSNRK